jgi:hypothetical protein
LWPLFVIAGGAWFFAKRTAMARIAFALCGVMRTLFAWQGCLSDLSR